MEYQWKQKTEYMMLALIFAAMIQSIFAGFYIEQYHWALVITGALVLLASCILIDYVKWTIPCYILMIAGLLLMKREALINGFRIISNKMTDAINQSTDMGFYYYVSVDLDHSRVDSVLAVFFFFLCAGLLIGVMRYKPLSLFVFTSLFQVVVMILAPYAITSAFLLFLGAWAAYYNFRKNHIQFGGILFAAFFIIVIPLYFYDQVVVPEETAVKRFVLLQVRKAVQGDEYQVTGGIGNGEIGKTGAVSLSGTKLFRVSVDDHEETLYLKGYVSGDYQNGVWKTKEEEAKIFAGESALGLPFLFPELKIDELIPEKEQKDLFHGDRELTIAYQKKNDASVLMPYFADINEMKGIVSGDTSIIKTNAEKQYQIRYYSMKDSMDFLKLEGKVQESILEGLSNSEIESNYFYGMQGYQNYIEETYLKVPENIREKIQRQYTEAVQGNTLYEKAKSIQNFLKKNYEYTYRPGLTPEGKDPVLYFLEDSKKGFCTQYASAAVFLFRSCSIPARYVEGYKIRADQWKNGSAQVTDYDAHAWAEVYVTNIGWIPVDVTGEYTGKEVYQKIQTNEKNQKRIPFTKKEFLENVKWIVIFMTSIAFLCGLYRLLKMLRKKRLWQSYSNREKILYYEKKLNKYVDFTDNLTGKAPNSWKTVHEIIQKAKYSPYEISEKEVVTVQRFLEIQQKKK